MNAAAIQRGVNASCHRHRHRGRPREGRGMGRGRRDRAERGRREGGTLNSSERGLELIQCGHIVPKTKVTDLPN